VVLVRASGTRASHAAKPTSRYGRFTISAGHLGELQLEVEHRVRGEVRARVPEGEQPERAAVRHRGAQHGARARPARRGRPRAEPAQRRDGERRGEHADGELPGLVLEALDGLLAEGVRLPRPGEASCQAR
jgi:hypothetical protein